MPARSPDLDAFTERFVTCVVRGTSQADFPELRDRTHIDGPGEDDEDDPQPN
jgi:hypothetical protein